MDISANTVWAYAERSVTAPLGRIRTELVRLLGQLKFAVRTDQLTLVEGVRGSKFAGGSRSEAKVPVAITIRLTGAGHESPGHGGSGAAEPGTEGAPGGPATVSVQLADTWKFPSRRPIEVYQALYREVLADIDTALRRIDPAAAEFPAPQHSVHADAPPPSASAGRMTQAANRFLDAESAHTPRGWRESGDVIIHSPRAMAVLPIEAVYGMVTVGALVASKPGPMPPQLVAQVERFTGRLEQFLQQTGGQRATVWLEIAESDTAVVEFLVQQARIREEVPLRTLQVCVTCRLAKVVNPDYTKLKNRRSRVNVLSGSIGAFISPAGVSPFVLIGRLAQLNQLDPEFVCPRCQGLHAESSLITFCARCGEQCDDSALRTCAKCRFDYRGLARTVDLWQDPPPVPEQIPMPAPGESAPYPAVWLPPLPGSEVPGGPLPWEGTTGPDSLGDARPPVGDWPEPEPAVWPPPSAAPLSPPTPAATETWPAPDPASGWPAPEPATQPAAPEAWPAPEPAARTQASTAVWPTPDPTASWPAPAPGAAADATGWEGGGAAFQGWYPDPHGRHEVRWWDGFAWTDHVGSGGVTRTDRP
ncbi:DUF2510 domain-containing protein [Nakamurella silvestris]|nr:DUF2510 domain-containing protein [Nakamurella silvestris]